MGYLGLDQTPIKDDNMFQRMFWPSDHAGETDQLGKQGFWVCLGVALFSTVVLTAQGHWLIGLLTLLFYGLGGVGVREHSTAAAVLVAVAYLMNILASAFVGIPPSILSMAASVLLLANIRGTWIADRWSRRGDRDAMPERMSESIADWLVDQMPARIWPAVRIPFFCLSGLYLLLTVAGTIVIGILGFLGMPRRLHVDAHSPKPNTTIQVAPPR